MKICISFYSVLLKSVYFYTPQFFYTLQFYTVQRKRYKINLALQVSSKDKDNSINGAGETAYPYGKKMMDHNITSYTKLIPDELST